MDMLLLFTASDFRSCFLAFAYYFAVMDGTFVSSEEMHVIAKQILNYDYDDPAVYKIQVKQFLEKLVTVADEEVGYRKSLEEQVEFLVGECRDKDGEIERLSSEAQEAICECRRQAEEMGENMFSKISAEMEGRVSVEKLVARLQRQLTAAQVWKGCSLVLYSANTLCWDM